MKICRKLISHTLLPKFGCLTPSRNCIALVPVLTPIRTPLPLFDSCCTSASLNLIWHVCNSSPRDYGHTALHPLASQPPPRNKLQPYVGAHSHSCNTTLEATQRQHQRQQPWVQPCSRLARFNCTKAGYDDEELLSRPAPLSCRCRPAEEPQGMPSSAPSAGPWGWCQRPWRPLLLSLHCRYCRRCSPHTWLPPSVRHPLAASKAGGEASRG